MASLSVLRARAGAPARRRTIENSFLESLASAADWASAAAFSIDVTLSRATYWVRKRQTIHKLRSMVASRRSDLEQTELYKLQAEATPQSTTWRESLSSPKDESQHGR